MTLTKDELTLLARQALAPLFMAGRGGFVVINGDGEREDSYTLGVVGMDALLRDPRNSALLTAFSFVKNLENLSDAEAFAIGKILLEVQDRVDGGGSKASPSPSARGDEAEK